MTISVISHLQAQLVLGLLEDLASVCPGGISVILTLNVRETTPFHDSDFPFPILRRHNNRPLGFGANHNAAFSNCATPFFCIVNPDVRVLADPFPTLLHHAERRGTGVVAPMVKSPSGEIEDSARRFPSFRILLGKAFGRRTGLDYSVGTAPIEPDWVAGMFMLFASRTFADVGGFDERYFLYYEDVDLCARLRKQEKKVVLDPAAWIVHSAQRTSHRRISYAFRHGLSMARYLLSDHSVVLPPLAFRGDGR